MKRWRIKAVPPEDGWHDYKYEKYDAPRFTVKKVITLWGLGWGWWPLIIWAIAASLSSLYDF